MRKMSTFSGTAMRKLFRAVAVFLYICLGHHKVFLRGLDRGYDEGWDDAVDTVQDWYTCDEDEQEAPF